MTVRVTVIGWAHLVRGEGGYEGGEGELTLALILTLTLTLTLTWSAVRVGMKEPAAKRGGSLPPSSSSTRSAHDLGTSPHDLG